MSGRRACSSANLRPMPLSSRCNPSPSRNFFFRPAAPNPCRSEDTDHESEKSKTSSASQEQIARHARAAKDAAHLRRDEAVVRDAENGSERLAANLDQAHVRNDGFVSGQENLRRAARDTGIRYSQFRNFQV